MRRSKAFTLVELLVVVAIMALLVSILLPSLAQARELVKRAVCQSQLKGVGTAIAQYGSLDSRSRFPLMAEGKDMNNNNWKQSDNGPFHTATEWGNAIQQNLYILVYRDLVTEGQYICPSATEDQKADHQDAGTRYGFYEARNISYGLQSPWSQAKKIILVESMKQDVAIIADRPPDDLPGQQGSDNHGDYEGESVLYAGTNVSFCSDQENKVGYNKNSIYVKDMMAANDERVQDPPGNDVSMPVHASDSVIYGEQLTQ